MSISFGIIFIKQPSITISSIQRQNGMIFVEEKDDRGLKGGKPPISSWTYIVPGSDRFLKCT
jgi:hypothetical protein